MSSSENPASSSASGGISSDLLALRAELARQPLRGDQDDARGDVERRHAHVGQPHQGRGSVVGVQGRHHQVTGLRGLDRDVGGFEVADFADHDDVGILSQEGAQRVGEIETCLFIDVDLVDAGQLDFGRVFSRCNIHARLVQDVQARVQRHRLAAAGRAGHQDHAVRALDRIEHDLLLVGLVAQRLDAELDARRVEDTQHDLFAVQGRQGADPEIDRAAFRQRQLHPPVLRHALFRDVELAR